MPMDPEQPAADPVTAKPEEEDQEEEEEKEAADAEKEAAEDALLDRAQALISHVVEQESNPNPRLIHALATICEDQEARVRSQWLQNYWKKKLEQIPLISK